MQIIRYKNFLLFLKTVVKLENPGEYEIFDETPDEDIYNVVYEKGIICEIATLIDRKEPAEQWLKDGICKNFEHNDIFRYKDILKNVNVTDDLEENRQLDMMDGQWQEILDLDTTLQKINYLIMGASGKMKFCPPKLGGDIIYHRFDIDGNDEQVNRGWLITKDNKELWLYNGRYWDNNGEETLRDIIQQVLKDVSCERYKNETVNWIKDRRDLHTDRDKFDNNIRYIGLENGVYDIETKQLLDFHPNFRLTSILPVSYNPKAKCPQFLKFISDVSHKEDKNFIQEYIGYLFYRKYTFAIFVLLLGHGRNGKTTLIKILTKLLGKNNVEHLPLHKLATDDFARVRLYRKWANLCADIETHEIKRTGALKSLSGGDPMFARGLYKDGFNFENIAKLLFASNELPVCLDKTFAMEERFAVVEFPNEFPRGSPDCDPFIYEKLIEELPGIFNYAMEGLDRLLKNNTFSEYKSIDNVRQYLSVTEDIIYKFTQETISYKIENEEMKDDVYQEYVSFAIKNDKVPMASNHFSTQFKRYATYYFRQTYENFSLNDGWKNKKRTWKGIELLVERPKKTGKNKKITDTGG